MELNSPESLTLKKYQRHDIGIINSRPSEGSQRLEALRSWANCYVRKIPDLKWSGTITKAPYPHFPDDVI